MQRSARRLALPELPVDYFLDSLRQLIQNDADWVPDGGEKSLYLRPFMFAKEAFLGVRPAAKVNYYLIASPAGPYFPGGVAPVSIWLSTDYARAGKGGTGAAKTAATTPRRWSPSRRPTTTGARRCCSSTPRRASTSKSSVA